MCFVDFEKLVCFGGKCVREAFVCYLDTTITNNVTFESNYKVIIQSLYQCLLIPILRY